MRLQLQRGLQKNVLNPAGTTRYRSVDGQQYYRPNDARYYGHDKASASSANAQEGPEKPSSDNGPDYAKYDRDYKAPWITSWHNQLGYHASDKPHDNPPN